MEADFSGYATKANLKCSDGRTITPQAFEHMDGTQVPLIWQHGHSEITNVLGHVLLEARKDGVYARGFFNSTPHGQAAKALVQHGDIKRMSIFANELIEKAKSVLHGMIKEVSLVIRRQPGRAHRPGPDPAQRWRHRGSRGRGDHPLGRGIRARV